MGRKIDGRRSMGKEIDGGGSIVGRDRWGIGVWAHRLFGEQFFGDMGFFHIHGVWL
jgi:hypothetical protein